VPLANSTDQDLRQNLALYGRNPRMRSNLFQRNLRVQYLDHSLGCFKELIAVDFEAGLHCQLRR
jgi:hypothetical protein